jgi:hypothetical protein
MRILFIVDQLKDLVSDPLYVGLVRLLGQEHVVDYPSKAILHESSKKLWFLPQFPGSRYSDMDVCTLLDQRFFDIVCLTTPRIDCINTLKSVYRPKHFPPIVFIDGADDDRIRHEVLRCFPLSVYFKREYVWKGATKAARFIDCARSFRFDRRLFAKTFPLPISVVLDELPQLDVTSRDIDVSFYGHISHRKRVTAVNRLKGMSREGVRVAAEVYAAPTDRKYKLQSDPVKRVMTKLFEPMYVAEQDVNRRLDPLEYYRTLARSKIAVSIRGGGFDTYRYWEIPACRSMLLSEVPDIVIPHNFEHRKQAVFCRPDLRDLQELIRYYLSHEEEREAITEEAYGHLLKHHTCERRAAYFLETCARMI